MVAITNARSMARRQTTVLQEYYDALTYDIDITSFKSSIHLRTAQGEYGKVNILHSFDLIIDTSERSRSVTFSDRGGDFKLKQVAITIVRHKRERVQGPAIGRIGISPVACHEHSYFKVGYAIPQRDGGNPLCNGS